MKLWEGFQKWNPQNLAQKKKNRDGFLRFEKCRTPKTSQHVILGTNLFDPREMCFNLLGFNDLFPLGLVRPTIQTSVFLLTALKAALNVSSLRVPAKDVEFF